MLFPLTDPASAQETRRELSFAPPPPNNPLIGLVPYAEDREDSFPHSMEFDYLPLSSLVIDSGQYDWDPLETLLSDIASRGHQAVFRVYLEFPGRRDGIPQFLLDQGLRVQRYRASGENVVTPDYSDPRLRKVLVEFIQALGERYDQDPRIGYLTAGLLGHWGEWHTYPREQLFANQEVQAEIMSAYEAAFQQTPVLLRYPAGSDHPTLAPNVERAFGYHDDSFAWATLETGKPQDSWFFLTALREAGGLDRWKQYPIGGEIRPEAWGKVFDLEPGDRQIQDFEQCVQQTHASWLMDSGMFEGRSSQARRERAEQLVRQLGYTFHVPWYSMERVEREQVIVSLAIENRGVAPFYRHWPAELGLLNRDGVPVRVWPCEGSVKGLLPDEEPVVWKQTLDLVDLASGTYVLALRIPNPMPGGESIRFANQTQDADAAGWLSLGELEIE